VSTLPRCNENLVTGLILNVRKTHKKEGVELCEYFLCFLLLRLKYKYGRNLIMQILTQSLNAVEIKNMLIKDKESEREERHRNLYWFLLQH